MPGTRGNTGAGRSVRAARAVTRSTRYEPTPECKKRGEVGLQVHQHNPLGLERLHKRGAGAVEKVGLKWPIVGWVQTGRKTKRTAVGYGQALDESFNHMQRVASTNDADALFVFQTLG